ncbi:hypothetical protein K4039_18905 [Lyngbya sp. CCAP 1446/10]|uniref:hypothetical protein n=1 Tax=Microcoleaceae TaxID=1892252 RepID=UPI00223862FA|nr:hypothetical protein [Lyngbya sp. CCAP 1446/10]MCW6052105.1 hypothetical protein [Lyngbya sp. CCAP 1446/10]
MSEQALISESPATTTSAPETRIGNEMVEFLSVIQQTPRAYWPNLLQMMRLFLETVTVKPITPDTSTKAIAEIKTIDPLQQHEALSKLLQSWVDDGDEQEQTETAEVLRKALEENPVHI